jgi:multicomponent K+:H+ antiporter subunit E
MKRWLRFPALSAALLVAWLLLNQSVEPAHLLLGAALAVVVPWLVQPLLPHDGPRLRNPGAAARLLRMAVVEIVRSAFTVCRLILAPPPGGVNARFIRIPLDLRDRNGLAVLSCLINITPGTVWVELLPDTHELVLHVFDLHDTQWWVATIKQRYEQPLKDIFEGSKP